MNQITLYGITGRTELGLNEYIASTPSASGTFDTAYRLLAHRTYTIQAQEDAHLFNLTEMFWNEATDRYYSDVPDNEPNHEPEAYPEPYDYVPCEQQAYVSEADGWTCVTTFDLSSQPTPFKSLPVGTVFFDPFTKDMCRKRDSLLADVVAGDEIARFNVYSFNSDTFASQINIVYPVLPPTAQHLADGPSAQDLLVAQEWAPGSPADALLQAEGEWVPEPLATDPPQDHPEGWNAPASLPPTEDAPETQGIPVTYKVAMGNCYRLFHHGRQIALCPNYAQAEVIAQALAATFAGRLADFSMTLDYIEGATP